MRDVICITEILHVALNTPVFRARDPTADAHGLLDDPAPSCPADDLPQLRPINISAETPVEPSTSALAQHPVPQIAAEG